MPSLGLLIGGLLIYFVNLIWQAGFEYIVFYALYAASIVFVNTYLIILYPKNETHIHHWYIFMLLNTFCSHPNILVTMVGAWSQGVFVEGCSRWGLDPVWVQVDIPERLTENRQKLKPNFI